MMRTTLFFIFSLILATTGCVSVKLSTADDGTKRAVGVRLREPASPFSKSQNADVDASWQNSRNGNVISYLSDCKDPSDPPLDNIVQGVVAGLNSLNFESKETISVQGREGRRVLASGRVDGVPSLIDLLVFKRNQCIYILTHVGVKSAFSADREAFNQFVQGFQAP